MMKNLPTITRSGPHLYIWQPLDKSFFFCHSAETFGCVVTREAFMPRHNGPSGMIVPAFSVLENKIECSPFQRVERLTFTIEIAN